MKMRPQARRLQVLKEVVINPKDFHLGILVVGAKETLILDHIMEIKIATKGVEVDTILW